MAGSQTTKTDVPDWIAKPSNRAVKKAEATGEIGYVPYYGPDVAAFQPMQNASFDNTNQMAQAFGMAGGETNMPTARTYAGGMQGYSSAPLYNQSVETLARKNPNQYGLLTSFMVDPRQGDYRTWRDGAPEPQVKTGGGSSGKGGR